nr:hypothetical protein CFP56_09054 [Quercus suber]
MVNACFLRPVRQRGDPIGGRVVGLVDATPTCDVQKRWQSRPAPNSAGSGLATASGWKDWAPQGHVRLSCHPLALRMLGLSRQSDTEQPRAYSMFRAVLSSGAVSLACLGRNMCFFGDERDQHGRWGMATGRPSPPLTADACRSARPFAGPGCR